MLRTEFKASAETGPWEGRIPKPTGSFSLNISYHYIPNISFTVQTLWVWWHEQSRSTVRLSCSLGARKRSCWQKIQKCFRGLNLLKAIWRWSRVGMLRPHSQSADSRRHLVPKAELTTLTARCIWDCLPKPPAATTTSISQFRLTTVHGC